VLGCNQTTKPLEPGRIAKGEAMIKQQEGSQAVRYTRGEDHFRIAAESTPSQVHRWAGDWFDLWTSEVCGNRRVERFIDCCSRLEAVAELHNLKAEPLLTFIRELGEAWASDRIPSRSDSHLGEAQDVVERVDSWAKGKIIQNEAAKPQIHNQANAQSKGAGNGKKQPRLTVAAKMLEAVQKVPSWVDWTAEQWSNHLGCARSTVVGTKTWITYSTFRELARAKRVEQAYKKNLDVKVDKRRLPKRKTRPESLDD